VCDNLWNNCAFVGNSKKYLCNLVRYWLQVPWGWHESVETCSSVIICEIIVHLYVGYWVMTTTDWVLGTRAAVYISGWNFAENGMSCAFGRAGWFHTKLRTGKSNFSLVQLVCIGVAMETIYHVTIHLLDSSARRGVNRTWLDPLSRTLHKRLVPYRRLPHMRGSRFWKHRFFLFFRVYWTELLFIFQNKI